MIISRAPLRLTFGGAPTDLDSYSKKYGGFCISAAINKYSYVTVHRTFFEEILLKYSQMEKVKTIKEIQHPIFREVIRVMDFKTPQLEIVSIADIPSTGAGLGNSGSFTDALIKALHHHRKIPITQDKVAELACKINIDILKKAQGKQDEYACAIGGINGFTFNEDGTVEYQSLGISFDNLLELEDNLLLFYTGISHDTESILKKQENETNDNNKEMLENLHQAKDMGYTAKKVLERGYLRNFGALLNAQWENKEKRMLEINPFLLEIHNDLLINGAIGSKIIGSGQGGFVMAYAEDKRKVRKYMKLRNLEEVRWNFDFEGTKILI